LNESNEVSISFGLDPHDSLVDIEEAEKIEKYYRCPVCFEYLAVRKGPIRAHYFAHCPRGSDTPDCKLRSEGGLIEWMRETSLAPEEKLTNAHKMRTILLKEQHSEYYDLYGIVPTFSKEDFKDNEELQRTLGTLSISGDSIDGVVYPEAFHPNESEVQIRLKPGHSEYRVCISSGVKKDPVVGIWTATGLRTHDVFIGNENRAEKVKDSIPLREGETLYYVLDSDDSEPDFPHNRVRVGNHEIISFEVRKEIEDQIREILPKSTLEKSSFTVDLLLPVESNPQVIGPVVGSPNSEILISVIPPLGRNLELEIVSIPAGSSPVIPLPTTAPGEPRYYQTKFPNHGSKKMSVHYLDRHVFLQFHSTEKMAFNQSQNSIIDVDVYAELMCKGVKQRVYPWSGEKVEIEKPEKLDVKQFIELKGPGQLKINLEASTISQGKAKQIISYLDSITNHIQLDYDSGFRIFTIDYGILGKIGIEFVKPKKLLDILSDDEIARRIRAQNINPSSKTNTKLLRLVVGKSLDEEIPGGLKKRVRHVMERIRKGEI
jgi:hypothetical protein